MFYGTNFMTIEHDEKSEKILFSPIRGNEQIITICPSCESFHIMDWWEFGKHLASEDFCLNSSRIFCDDCSKCTVKRLDETIKAGLDNDNRAVKAALAVNQFLKTLDLSREQADTFFDLYTEQLKATVAEVMAQTAKIRTSKILEGNENEA